MRVGRWHLAAVVGVAVVALVTAAMTSGAAGGPAAGSAGGPGPVEARWVVPAPLPPPPPPPPWVDSWTTAPEWSGPLGTSFADQTVRIIAHLHAGGTRVRVRLSNVYGDRNVTFGAVTLGMRSTGPEIVPGTGRVVTFHGSTAVTVAKGGEVVSDPVKLTVKAAQDVVVSAYLPLPTGVATFHLAALQTNYVAAGDRTRELTGTGFGTTTDRSYFVTGVAVSGDAVATSIVAFGDSITDGAGSTAGANRRWPDLLSERLVAAYGSKARPVLNEGISGNRVLAGDAAGAYGSAIERLDRDVLQREGVTDVIFLEGVNDLCNSVPRATADQLIAGYQQLIARVHAKHVRIYAATILPLGGASRYTAALEQQRDRVNTWIRTSGQFDGVIDLDAAVRDPTVPTRMRPAYDSGDHLHPGDAGYQAMADAMDVALFR
jgi:lysophospholipase L1-like esterase